MAAPIYIPTNNVQGLLFSTSPSMSAICRLFDGGHSDGCEVLSDCDCDLHFSDDQQHWAFFPVPIGHLYIISTPGPGRFPGEGIGYLLKYSWASLVAQTVKNPPAMWKIWVWSLVLEDPLEEGMATHSSIPAWRIPRTEEPSRLQSKGLPRVEHEWATKHSTEQLFLVCKPKTCLHHAPSSSFMISKT